MTSDITIKNLKILFEGHEFSQTTNVGEKALQVKKNYHNNEPGR